MDTVTISKKEYKKLIEKALRYEYIRQSIAGNLFSAPKTKNVKTIIGDFEKTGLYNKKFLDSLEKGLKRSSHF